MNWELLSRCNLFCTRLQRWWESKCVLMLLSTNTVKRWKEQNVMRISVTEEFPLDLLNSNVISLSDYVDALNWKCWHWIVNWMRLKVHLLVSWIFITLTVSSMSELDLLKWSWIFITLTGTTLNDFNCYFYSHWHYLNVIY